MFFLLFVLSLQESGSGEDDRRSQPRRWDINKKCAGSTSGDIHI